MNNGVVRKASAQGDLGVRGFGNGVDRSGPRRFPPGLPTWNAEALRAAWARQASGGDPVTILCMGDSVTEGTGASDWVNRWSEVMRSYLQAATGVNTGSSLVPAHMSLRGFSADSRWTYSPLARSAWSAAGNGGYNGGTIWNSPGASGTDLTFDPQLEVDGFTLWWVQNGLSNNTWEAKINGVSVGGPYATTQGNGIYSQTFRAVARGRHVFTYSALGPSTRAYILGVDAFRDVQGGAKVITDGVWSSLMSVNWEAPGFGGTLAYTMSKQVAANKVDCMIWAYGLNHRIQNRSLAEFRGLFDTLATYQANATYRPASIMLMVPPPPQAGGTANGAGLFWDQYAQVIREAAARYNWGLIDVTAAWGTYANKPANYIDDVHPTNTGYAEMGKLAADAVLAAVGQSTPATPARLRGTGLGYLLLGAVPTDYVESPDSSALDITGEIDIAMRIDPTAWSKQGGHVFASKWSSTNGDKSWEWACNASAVMQFQHWDGSLRTAQASAGLGLSAWNGPKWVRIHRQTTGTTRFFTAADSVDLPSSWTQVGTDVVGTAGNLQAGNAPLTLARAPAAGSASNFGVLGGKFYRMQIWSGNSQSGGTLVYDARFDTAPAGASTFTESSGNGGAVNVFGTTI